MRHCCRILMTSALLWSICAHGETRLQPFLSHNVGRSAEVTISALRTSTHWNTFVTNIATYQGWTVAQTHVFLNNRAWTTCPHTGWFASDGLYFQQGGWQTGTIYRDTHNGEQFACSNGTPVFSTMCGNPVKKTAVDPEGACRNTFTESGTVTVFSGYATTQTTWTFTPFECHFK